MRFLYYNPWYTALPAAVFVPERYDPAQAPRLYQPAASTTRTWRWTR